MMKDSALQRIKELAQQRMEQYSHPSHDWSHIERVARMALHLAQEEGANTEVVLVSAYLHDLGRGMPGENHLSAGVRQARELMDQLGYPLDFQEAVLHCIRAHSFSCGEEPQTLEAQVLRDADRLDALGAIGIARCFAYGNPFYHPEEPIPQTRPLGPYCVDHFFEKLLRLAEGLYTPSARQLAEGRVAFMKLFLERLEKEIRGDL